MSSANENAARANKKTIRPEDVIEAAKELEFGAFVPQLQAALQGKWKIFISRDEQFFHWNPNIAHTDFNTKGYNDSQSEKLKQRRSKALQPEGASTGLQKGEPTVAQTNVGSKGKARDDSQPVMKRARRSSADGINTGTSSDDEESPSEEDERKGQDEEDEQLDDEEEEGEEGVEDVSASSERSEDEKDRLQEDPMEEKNNEDDGNRDEVLDGHESD